MEINENFIEVFKKTAGAQIKTATGLTEVYYERAINADFPRATFFFTIWSQDGEHRGTLTVNLAGNTAASEIDAIAQKALYSLDGMVYVDDRIYFYLYSGRVGPVEDSDKTLYRRLLTLEFIAILKGV